MPQELSETKAIRDIIDHIASQRPEVQASHAEALERIGSTFALMLTSVGMPMFLAGEEFADVHDFEPNNDNLKQSDPVDFERRKYLGHNSLLERVSELIRLRTEHPALQRNEVAFFYRHPTINDNDGIRVFAYCRTGGQKLGSRDQVVVIANTGPNNFYGFNIDHWLWSPQNLLEHGRPRGATIPQTAGNVFTVSLAPFQVRVFST